MKTGMTGRVPNDIHKARPGKAPDSPIHRWRGFVSTSGFSEASVISASLDHPHTQGLLCLCSCL